VSAAERVVNVDQLEGGRDVRHGDRFDATLGRRFVTSR
jgi:hypothetical protein